MHHTRSPRHQFIKCLSEELRTTATHTCPNLVDLTFEDDMQRAKSTAVIPVSVCIRCSEALSCPQKVGETFRHFSIKVRRAVTDCNFVVPCAHATSRIRCNCNDCNGVNYTNSVFCDILLSGIYNVYIRREVLSDPAMATKPINIISAVEGKESACDAVASSAPRVPTEAALGVVIQNCPPAPLPCVPRLKRRPANKIVCSAAHPRCRPTSRRFGSAASAASILPTTPHSSPHSTLHTCAAKCVT